jgi:methyltransferase (TIGR00027 family)
MVAAARALASQEDDRLFEDPYAAPLVRAVGVDFFTQLVDGEIPLSALEGDGPRLMGNVIAVRTRFFDDFFVDAGKAGIRQAVILASGLDARPYRLPWPQGSTVYEIDQPRVIEFKTATMSAIDATPTAERRAVAVDLRDDWPAALRRSGFDDSQPTAWSAEGLLVYLPPDAQDRLFDNITSLSAPGSQLATEYHPDAGASIGERAKEMSRQWGDRGLDIDLSQLFYAGERNPVVDYLTGHGWQVSARTRSEVFAGYGREFPDTEEIAALRNSLAVIATRK